MIFARRRNLLLVIPTLLVLAACSTANLQEDPRNGPYASLLTAPYWESVAKLDDVVKRDPNALQAQYMRASIEVEHGNIDAGITRLDQVLQRWPAYSFGYSERSRANWLGGHYEKAAADANLAIRYRPDVPRNYIRRAVAYLYMHKAQEALEDLKTAQKLDPKENAKYVHLLTGRALADLRQYHEAIPVLTQAIQDSPQDPRPLVERSLCYAHLKKWDKATADCDRAMTLKKDNPNVNVLDAALLSASGQKDAAKKQWARAIKLAKNDKDVVEIADLGPESPSISDAAAAAMANKNSKLAKQILSLTESRRPLEPEELFALAKINVMEDERFRAAKLLNECVATSPTWLAPRIELIKLYVKDKRVETARQVQKEGLRLPLSDKDRKVLAAAI